MEKHWYVLQVFSGQEKYVEHEIKSRAQHQNLSHCFGEVLVPTQKVMEIRGGQKRKSEQKFFPGYVLIHMAMDDDVGKIKSCNKCR